MRIYHLALAGEWAAARDAGEPYRRSTVGVSLEEEGFVHCSFAGQLAATARRFYAGRDDVVVLVVDTDRLAAPVVVEPVGDAGGEEFPHVYGPIDLDAVSAVVPAPPGPDGVPDVSAAAPPPSGG
ncbi:MAG TPA: DUF952 domain-containing protein [Acidimicrobiales bacterium]